MENAKEYFIAGESVTVESATNGFVVHSELGATICGDIPQMVEAVLKTTTNHEHFVALAEAKKAQEANPAEEEAEDAEFEAAEVAA
jgi:hypothetical protein